MAVSFQYSLNDSPLAARYNSMNYDLNQTVGNRLRNECPAVSNVLDSTLSKLDNAVQKAADVAAKIADVVGDIEKCVLGKDDQIVYDTYNAIVSRAGSIISGSEFDKVYNSIQNMVDYVNNTTTLVCAELLSMLNTITSALDKIINTMISLDASLGDLSQLAKDIANTIMKVAAFLNCISGAIMKANPGGGFDNLMKYTRPESYPIYNEAKSVLDSGGTQSDAVLAAHAKINGMVNKETRLTAIKNTFEV